MTFKANDSLTEQIARFLGKRIILGEMTAGERIQELRIAAELDVSRGSVREALLILERRHLVTIYPRRGAVVSALDADAADEFFELWFALVEQVLVAFCHSWHSEELAPFFDIGTRLAQAQQQEDLPAYYDSAIELLEKLYPLGRNRYLQQTLDDLLPLTQRCFYAVLHSGKTQMAKTSELVDATLQAITARDENRVRSAIADFVSTYRRILREALS